MTLLQFEGTMRDLGGQYLHPVLVFRLLVQTLGMEEVPGRQYALTSL